MALFKILKGSSSALSDQAIREGYCYVTTDEGKMYIDISNDKRICLNSGDATHAETADQATKADSLTNAYLINGVKFNGTSDIYFYGVCGTAAATAAKTVTLHNDSTGGSSKFMLKTGVTIAVKFTYANSASSPTLNVNGTGAKPIYQYGTTKASTSSASTGWVAGAVLLLTYDGTGWIRHYWANSNTVPAVYCETAAGTAAKTATCTEYALAAKSYLHLIIKTANSAASALTLNVNSKGAKPLYINGSASSSRNYTLPAGSYITYYDGTNYYIRTDGKLPGSIEKADAFTSEKIITLTGDVEGAGSSTGANGWEIVTTVKDDSHNHSTYVQKAGDTMTGDLNFPNTKGIVQAQGTGSNYTVPIKWDWADKSATVKHQPSIGHHSNGDTHGAIVLLPYAIETAASGSTQVNPWSANDGLYISKTRLRWNGNAHAVDKNPTLAWGTTSAVATIFGTQINVTMPANPNTDAKVKQGISTAGSWRSILSHYTATAKGTEPAEVTNQVYYTGKAQIQPSTGSLYLAGNLSAGGTATITGNTTLSGTLSVAKKATLSNDLAVTGSTSISGGLTVASTALFKGLVKIGESTQTATPAAGIAIHDLRDVTPTPGMFGEKRANFYFDQVDGRWASILHMHGWTASGYASWELAGNSATDKNITTLKYRTGLDGSWTNWHKVLLADSSTGVLAQKLYFNADSLSENTTSSTGLDYVCGITGFASGGELQWKAINQLKVGYATQADSAGTANTATSAGTATTASKLTTSTAGGTTTPVYFSGGVPKACTMIKSGAWYGGLTYVGGDGVIEVGKYIDFHVNKTGTNDYDVRITAATTGLSISGTTSGSFKGNLDGNASTANTATSAGIAGQLTDITENDKASSSDTWRRLWFSYNNNTTGRPAYDDRFAIQTSTGTLKAPIFSGNLNGNATSATYLTSQGANTANTRTQAREQAVVAGGWSTNEAGYGSTYGTTLDVSGYSTWYHRLAFHTNGEIDYWQGINTNTLTKIGRLLTSANYSSHLDSRYVKKAGDSMSGTLSWGGNVSSLNLRTGHASYDGIISYQTSGNEAMLFTTKSAVTSFMFVNGEDTITNMAADRWTKVTPGLQIKNNSVAIGKLIGNDVIPSYKLEVNGTGYFSNLLTVATGNSHYGVKLGSTYVNAINEQVIFQNNGAIRFGPDNWDWNCWAGLKYVHGSNNKNGVVYLGVADGTVFNANVPQSEGTLALPGIRYLSINGKTAIDAHDTWLRINESKAFSSGIYMGTNIVRTDGQFQIGSNGGTFYAKSDGTGYFDNDVKVKGHVFAYNYGRDGNAAPALIFDKPSDNYTGIGSNGVNDTIYFGAVTTDTFAWKTDYQQKWRFNGEVQALGANAFRMVQGNYGVFLRNDGSDTYFLITASGDQYGNWNGLRPFYFNNASGNVTMGHNLSVGGTIYGNLSGNATTSYYPYGFTSYSTNATWGNQTGSTVVCWNEANGGSVDWRRDNPSSGKISLKVDGRFYGNEGAKPAMLMTSANGYWGIGDPDGADNVWIRTTSLGIIPYQSGGHGSLGTSSWPFNEAYLKYLNVTNDASNNGNDALAYFRHYSNNDWTVKIDSGSFDYGLIIQNAHTATNALSITGGARLSNTLRIGNGTALDGNYCEGLRIRAADGAWATIIMGATADTGTNANAWSIHRKSDNNFCISRNSSDGANGLVMTTTGMGLGTTAPSYRLHVAGDIYANGGWLRVSGSSGLFFESYGGGFYMSDTTWVRTYNNKSLYCSQTIGAGGRIYAGYDSGVTGSISCSNWFRTNGVTGLYNGDYGTHLMPNTVSNYAGWRVSGKRGDYHGILIGDATTSMAIMSIDNSHQGLYTQSGTGWIIYNNNANGCIALGGADIVSTSYKVTTNGSHFINGSICTNGNINYYNGGNVKPAIRFQTGDTNGAGISIGAGGYVVIGSGESAANFVTDAALSGGSEQTYITSDGSIYFHTNCQTIGNRTTTCYINTSGRLYGAAWNDYAEFRECITTFEAGQVVCENGDDTLSLATERLQPGACIVSDTFGFAIGETDIADCPIAVSGRVLAYPYEPRESYKAGDPVCTGPGGTVSKMTREEVREYPDRMIGTVSAIPKYETWGQDNVPVNGRIWIKVV